MVLSRIVEVREFPIRRLTQYIPYPCFIENDANAGGIAEWWNHEDHENMVYLSVQRGVGGAVLLDGVRYMGHHHHSGEFGHMCIVPNGKPCLCGMRGCLEAYCSTARISTDLGITREEFFASLEAGNPDYLATWKEYLDYLAIGINNIRMVLDCNIVLAACWPSLWSLIWRSCGPDYRPSTPSTARAATFISPTTAPGPPASGWLSTSSPSLSTTYNQ